MTIQQRNPRRAGRVATASLCAALLAPLPTFAASVVLYTFDDGARLTHVGFVSAHAHEWPLARSLRHAAPQRCTSRLTLSGQQGEPLPARGRRPFLRPGFAHDFRWHPCGLLWLWQRRQCRQTRRVAL